MLPARPEFPTFASADSDNDDDDPNEDDSEDDNEQWDELEQRDFFAEQSEMELICTPLPH